MKQSDINELHKIIEDFAIEKGYDTKHFLIFLTSCLTGTMAMKGYSQDFFDTTCERMKNNFKKMKSYLNE